MAEDLTQYLTGVGIRVRYMHADVETIERMELIRGLRLGEFDVLVGINLLREGLDIPEVSMVAILDADKEGFLRSETSLIQTIGRAARNADGLVVLYADTITPSMRRAMDETERRRQIQDDYNKAHGIIPQTIRKDVREIMKFRRRTRNPPAAAASASSPSASGTKRSESSKSRCRRRAVCSNSSTPPSCATVSSSCARKTRNNEKETKPVKNTLPTPAF